MPKSTSSDDSRKRLTAICLALPEATCQDLGQHAAFLVRKKIFAYYLNNHHGDGIVGVTCKVAPGDNQVLVKAQPERFSLPAYLASRGWVALRLDVDDVDWDEVAELMADSYRRIAPKRLAAQVKLMEDMAVPAPRLPRRTRRPAGSK